MGPFTRRNIIRTAVGGTIAAGLFPFAGTAQETAIRKHYDEFVASLPPLKKGADYSGNGNYPEGWGWVIGDGNMPYDPAPNNQEVK